jgi:hypothetical protein
LTEAVCLSGGRGRAGDSRHTAHGRAALQAGVIPSLSDARHPGPGALCAGPALEAERERLQHVSRSLRSALREAIALGAQGWALTSIGASAH